MAEKSKETKTVDSSRRGFLSKSAVGAGAALTGTMLGAINNGAKADGDPIPLGGGMPMTGWAAADGIEFKRAQEMACDEINALGGILGRPGASGRRYR